MVTKLNPKHNRELKRIIRSVRVFFNRHRFHPRRNVFLDTVVLAHVSKGLTVAQSVMCLIDGGFPEEAFGLSRTLVEIALNLRFITNRYSERRAQRFVHYYARWKLESIRRALKHFKTVDEKGRTKPKYSKTELSKLVPDYENVVKIARKFPNRTSWTETRNRKASRGGAWMMAQEPDKFEKIDGVPLKWEFDYDWIYFWTSQYVHATVVSVDTHAVLPREAFSIRLAPERGYHTADLAVFNTGLYVRKILVMAFRAIKHSFPDELSKPLGSFLTEMANEEVADAG